MGARLTTTILPLTREAPPAPTSGAGFWPRLARDLALVGGSTAVCHLLGVGTSLLLRVLLSPAQMGVWQGLKLFLNYSNYANLGVSKGAARELAIARGSGNLANAERGLNLAFTVNVISSTIYGIALLVAAAGCFAWGDSPLAWAWSFGLAVMAMAVVVQRHVTFHVTILRAEQKFRLTSLIAMLEAALALVAGGIATWLWGLPGLFLSMLVVLGGSWVALRSGGARRLQWAWDRSEVARLVGIGGPIMLAGVVSTLFRSIDKLMILACCADREHQLGCYGLALLVSSQLFGLATMLTVTISPRFGELFGRTGGRASSAHLMARASELMAAVLALLGGVAIVAGPAVLNRMFPEYGDGLAALSWVVAGAVLAGLALPVSQVLTAVGRERVALLAVVVAASLAALGCGAALMYGFGLVGVAVAMAAANACYWVLLLAAMWREIEGADRARYVLVNSLTLLPTLGLAWIYQTYWAAADDISSALVGVCLVVVIWFATTLIGWRYGGWAETWKGGDTP